MNSNHAALLGAYKDIAEILGKNGIRFYAAYGTAIGAIRHSGFIPWDDDLDIAVFADDLDEVNRVLSEGLDRDKYYYHAPSADSHPHVVVKTDDMVEDIKSQNVSFIDIFLFLDYPESAIRRALMYPFIGFELLSHKIIRDHGSKAVKEFFYAVMNVSRKMSRLISVPDTPRVCFRAVEIRENSWERKDLGEPVPHRFEDTTIPLPCNADKMLREYYGDYMTPPPEDQRAGATGFPYSLLEDYLEDQSDGPRHHRLCRADLPK